MRSPDITLLPKNIRREHKPYLSLIEQLLPEGERIAVALSADPTRDGLLAAYCLSEWVVKQKEQEHNKPGFIQSIFQRHRAKTNEKLLEDMKERTATFIETGYTQEEKKEHYPRNIQLATHEYLAHCRYYEAPQPAMSQPPEDFTKIWKKRWSQALQTAA